MLTKILGSVLEWVYKLGQILFSGINQSVGNLGKEGTVGIVSSLGCSSTKTDHLTHFAPFGEVCC